ncbi:hypothetical protein F8A10_08645 [Paracoccus kondratievae]|nr:hypothetical protein F8A10_08645 [Paracoccus kondratievae]
MTGILTISIAVALVGAVIGFVAFDLPVWAALLVYVVSGTAAMLFIAWRRFRCAERHEVVERSTTAQ